MPRDSLRITLDRARQIALASNPEFRANAFDTAIAAGRLRQAGTVRFNPLLEVLGAGGGARPEYSASQELEVFGQKGLRVRAERAGLERARASVLNDGRLILGDVDRNFYRLISASRRAALAASVEVLNERLIGIAQKQLAEGEISRLDFNLAVVELGRSKSRAVATVRERESLALELRRLLGVGADTAIVPVLSLSDHAPITDSALEATVERRDIILAASRLNVDSLTGVALQARPDVIERRAALRQLRGDMAVAAREGLPNLIVRTTIEPREDGSRNVRPGIGMTLPLFNRNRGEVSARLAAASQAALMVAATQAQVRTEVENAVQTYAAAASQVEVLESTVLLPARKNRQLLEVAYREGKVGLPILILIRSQVTDAELEYWEAWLGEREAGVTLAEVTGENVKRFLPDASSERVSPLPPFKQ